MVTLEVDAPDVWNDDVKADQVRKQAIESVVGAIRHGIVVDGVSGVRNAAARARIVGVPVVEAIIAVVSK